VVGDVVKSAKPGSTVEHFVTPKKSDDLNQEYVVLKALGVTADQITDGNANQIVQWDGGEAVPGEPLKRRVKRDATGKTEVKIKTKQGGAVVKQMDVWVIHAKVIHNKTVSADTGIEAASGGFTRIKTDRNQVLFEIEPKEICEGLATGAEIPDLSGNSDTTPPGVMTLAPGAGSQLKWDVSQRVRIVVRDYVPSLIATDYRGDPNIAGPALTAKAASFPATRVELVTYPTIAVESNDDVGPRDDREDNDPYSASNGTGMPTMFKPAIGQLVTEDKPTVPAIKDSAGSWGQDIDWRNQFDTFVRVEIGTGTSAKWYRISDPSGALWQAKKLFERQWTSGVFPPVTEWQDHGSGIVHDNSGW
jgi:hypothetical protein